MKKPRYYVNVYINFANKVLEQSAIVLYIRLYFFNNYNN